MRVAVALTFLGLAFAAAIIADTNCLFADGVVVGAVKFESITKQDRGVKTIDRVEPRVVQPVQGPRMPIPMQRKYLMDQAIKFLQQDYDKEPHKMSKYEFESWKIKQAVLILRDAYNVPDADPSELTSTPAPSVEPDEAVNSEGGHIVRLKN